VGGFEDELREFIKREAQAIFEEMHAERQLAQADGRQLDEETLARIRQYELISRKPYLTKAEAALYLDVSEKSVEEWSARADDANPFPEVRAGSAPRYSRSEVDAWVVREARRRRDTRL
jgi:hypothetical protein